MRGAVEAVAAHPEAVRDLRLDRVAGRGLRHGGVERRVEDGDLRQVRAHRHGRADAGEVGRIVQRGHRDQPLDLGEHLLVDDRGLGEEHAAVHHAVPDRGQFGGVQAEPVLGQLLRDGLQGGVVVGDRPVLFPSAARGEAGVLQAGGLLADPLDQADGQPAPVAHVEQLVLHRRGAGVEDEDTGRVHRVEVSLYDFCGVRWRACGPGWP